MTTSMKPKNDMRTLIGRKRIKRMRLKKLARLRYQAIVDLIKFAKKAKNNPHDHTAQVRWKKADQRFSSLTRLMAKLRYGDHPENYPGKVT